MTVIIAKMLAFPNAADFGYVGMTGAPQEEDDRCDKPGDNAEFDPGGLGK